MSDQENLRDIDAEEQAEDAAEAEEPEVEGHGGPKNSGGSASIQPVPPAVA